MLVDVGAFNFRKMPSKGLLSDCETSTSRGFVSSFRYDTYAEKAEDSARWQRSMMQRYRTLVSREWEPHSGTSTSALCANVFIIQLGSRARLYLHYCTNCEELRMDI